MFNEHLSLEFWLYVGYPGWEGQNQQTPDLWVSISGNKVLARVPLYVTSGRCMRHSRMR